MVRPLHMSVPVLLSMLLRMPPSVPLPAPPCSCPRRCSRLGSGSGVVLLPRPCLYLRCWPGYALLLVPVALSLTQLSHDPALLLPLPIGMSPPPPGTYYNGRALRGAPKGG